ncbi:MAG: hypothetical protein MUC77_05070 [Chromatiaceae bacterium]|nr:hypothetical protein [Chromatiaceae bacterium]
MIRLPFGRKPAGEAAPRPSAAFAAWCEEELERRRDARADFDEPAFRAAVALALGRLKAKEREGRA